MIKDTSAQDVVMTKSKKAIWKMPAAVLGLVLVAVSASGFISQESVSHSVERALVQIATVEHGTLLRDIAATGRFVAANAPQLYAPQTGYVKLEVKAGDQVELDQVLAIVDSPELNNQLQQQQSELTRLTGELARTELTTRRETLTLARQADLAELDLIAAQRENDRSQMSAKDHLISQRELEQAEDTLARAKVTHKHALREVQLAKDTLAFELKAAQETVARQQLVVDDLQRKIGELTIKANVAGVVGNLLVQDRALVSANAILMTLVDLSAYEAEINIAESYAGELGLGMQVEIRVGNQTAIGTLSAISPEITDREVTARVKFPQNQINAIRQNQQLSARVLLEQKNGVLKVRRGSFTQSGGYVAYRVRDDIAQRIDIRLGASSMREVEIISGVQAGDQLIISNYEAFTDAPSVLLR